MLGVVVEAVAGNHGGGPAVVGGELAVGQASDRTAEASERVIEAVQDLAGRAPVGAAGGSRIDRVLTFVTGKPDGLTGLGVPGEPVAGQLVPGADVGEHLLAGPGALPDRHGKVLRRDRLDLVAE